MAAATTFGVSRVLDVSVAHPPINNNVVTAQVKKKIFFKIVLVDFGIILDSFLGYPKKHLDCLPCLGEVVDIEVSTA